MTGRGDWLVEPVRGTRRDVLVVAFAAVFVIAAAAVGRHLLASGVNIFLAWPPLLAEWLPHVGPGTPAAGIVAVGVVVWGPGLAARMRWRPLLWASWAAAFIWTFALALVDGWQRGVVERLTSDQEYLHDVPRVADIGAMLRAFADHILTRQVDPTQTWFWTTHVGGHPPGALLVFVGLDRIGLGGGGPAGVAVMLAGSSVCAAVAVTVRALGHEDLARRALPFVVLFPGAVWVGVSADGMFAAMLAWAAALVALGATRVGAAADLAALGGGLLMGYCLYLSYGLVLGGLLPLAVLVAAGRYRPVAAALVGVLVVVVAFTAAGFWWFTGYEHVKVIYAASIASTRPYAYFVWANLAAAAFVLGPAGIAALRRMPGLPGGLRLLMLAAVAAMVVADVSGLSKGEVERIWLPFTGWAMVACAELPRPRMWLAVQAGLALAVNHLLLTVW